MSLFEEAVAAEHEHIASTGDTSRARAFVKDADDALVRLAADLAAQTRFLACATAALASLRAVTEEPAAIEVICGAV